LAVSWSDSGARTGPHEIGLIARIAAGNDDDAARRLYRKYRMELFRFGFHVLHDEGLVDEMVQETFIKFCQQAPNYDASRGPVRGWLFTVLTVDQALDKLPSIYADVMRLVRDGFTHSEIAGRLGIPIGTVKSRMARAAGPLRAELANLQGSDGAF
jgi:DNA-directed RNA polymerase specialized sigma24 family protein